MFTLAWVSKNPASCGHGVFQWKTVCTKIFDYNTIISFSAKKSKATIELIVRPQPDKHRQNEVWYDRELDKEEIGGNHLDKDYGENGNLLM